MTDYIHGEAKIDEIEHCVLVCKVKFQWWWWRRRLLWSKRSTKQNHCYWLTCLIYRQYLDYRGNLHNRAVCRIPLIFPSLTQCCCKNGKNSAINKCKYLKSKMNSFLKNNSEELGARNQSMMGYFFIFLKKNFFCHILMIFQSREVLRETLKLWKIVKIWQKKLRNMKK